MPPNRFIKNLPGGFIFMKIRKSVKRTMNLLQIEKLRKNQLKPINAILDGHDTMVIAPTSFGKSLLYLIPALAQDTGITLLSNLSLPSYMTRYINSGSWTFPHPTWIPLSPSQSRERA